MKIIVIVRTRDEEERIGQFCTAYENADLILVGDGGSVDNTVSIAQQFPNVIVGHYPFRVQLQKGHWRNNDSDHTNWLIRWAKEYEPDWIIFDDCDIRPNYLLRNQYRSILYHHDDYETIVAVRVYLWGMDKYFPKLSSPLGEPNGQGSLWAWRGNLGLRTVDAFPHFTFRLGKTPVTEFRTDTKCLELVFPYCLLHYSWDTIQHVEKKLAHHRESGITPGMRSPLEFGGELQPLEEFIHE